MKTLIFLVFVLILSQSVWATEPIEPVEQTGYIGTAPLSIKTVPKSNGTVTTGYIENHALRLKTRETATGAVTTGWVDGKYVRIKTKPTTRKD